MASLNTTAVELRNTILVVDPDCTLNGLLDPLALKEGWNVRQAANNEAALSLAQETFFDLIITSERTSGRDDLELLRKIRAVRPHIRMIILTDRRTPAEVITALRENVFSYFSAPLDVDSLLCMVRLAMTEPYWDDGIEVISATPNWFRLLARCTLDTASRLVQFLRQADLPAAEREDIASAMHEILTNAIEHGGNFSPDQYLEISYLRTRRAVACRVKDPGTGFSLEELRHAAINNPPEEPFTHILVREEQGRRPGGFGILLAQKLVDELIYGERGNDVILIKYLEPDSRDKFVAANP